MAHGLLRWMARSSQVIDYQESQRPDSNREPTDYKSAESYGRTCALGSLKQEKTKRVTERADIPPSRAISSEFPKVFQILAIFGKFPGSAKIFNTLAVFHRDLRALPAQREGLGGRAHPDVHPGYVGYS
jgi:hypothetical protein